MGHIPSNLSIGEITTPSAISMESTTIFKSFFELLTLAKDNKQILREGIDDLRDNEINDISALGKLTYLSHLYIGGNPIADYSPVSFVDELHY